MNINFTSKLIVNKNLKSLKNPNIPKLEKDLKKYVEAPILSDVIGDIVILSDFSKRKKALIVKYSGDTFEVSAKKPIEAEDILSKIIDAICYKNNLPWYMDTPKGRMNFFKKLILKYSKIESNNQ